MAPAHYPCSDVNATVTNKCYALSANPSHPCTIHNCSIHTSTAPSIVHSQLLVFDLPTSTGVTAKTLVDCGSTTLFMSRRFANKHHITTTNIANAQVVKLADGSIHSTCKVVSSFPLYFNNRTIRENFLVLPIENFDIILGMPFLKKHNPTIDWSTNLLTFPDTPLQQILQQFNIDNSTVTKSPSPPPPPIEICNISARQLRKSIKKNEQVFLLFVRRKKKSKEVEFLDSQLNVLETDIASKLVSEFSDVFPKDLPKKLPPKRFLEHNIRLLPGSTPTFKNHHRLSPQDLDELKVHIKDLLDHGFIRASHSPYGAPVLFAKKAGEVKRRLCIDYRDLNRITVKDKYPLPRVDELLDRLHGAKYFTKLDLRSGYHQVRVADDDIQKTAFNTRYGQYEFLVLPFGLTGAPSTFMHLMNHILHPYLDKVVVAYLDDILIYSKTLEEHEEHVRTILAELRKHELYAKESKCEFFKRSVTFLGFIVTDQGIKVDPRKVAAAKEWPVPKSVSDCRSFLGFVGFYRKFIKNHSKIVAPISDLTKTANGAKFAWTSQAQEAFEQMIELLCSAPVLILPDPSKPYVVTTDASGFAIGACLQQDQGNGLQPICYMSKKMLDAETRYPIHDKEMLAIIVALREWRHYLHGSKFTVQVLTDHKSLVHFDTQPKLSERQARWNEFIAEFDFTIIYQEGKKNVVADALSRRADHEVNHLSTIGTDLLKEIQSNYKLDPLCCNIVKGIITSRVNRFTIKNKLILYDHKRVYVPDVVALKTKLLEEYHDSKLAGHVGIDKTIENLCRTYYWPNMYIDTKEYVRTCLTCQRTKAVNRKKAGLLQPLPIPPKRWHTVTMDFIVQLPKTKNGNDAIYVNVDKKSKMGHFVPMKTTATAPEVALLFFREVVKHHGVPKIIVSDRDSKFTSSFWNSLWELLDTKLAMSTAFHPQTDGQTEIMNRSLEQMLRAYTNECQDNWDTLLPYAEIAYNNSRNSSTGYSPFYVNYGEEINLPSNLLADEINSTNATVEDIVNDIQTTLKFVDANLQNAQDRQKKYADLDRREESFKVNDRVLLDTADITFTTGSKKFLDKFIGPYKIIEVVSATAYKLELPPRLSRLHPVFHVSKLRAALESNSFPDRVQMNRPAPELLDGEDAWYIEEIVGKKLIKGKLHYLVKWENYPTYENTWESAIKLNKQAKEHVDYYEKQLQ
jgi:hypothetical protein